MREFFHNKTENNIKQVFDWNLKMKLFNLFLPITLQLKYQYLEY